MKTSKYLPKGKHSLAEFSCCDKNFLLYSKDTKKILKKAVELSGATILDIKTNIFHGGGFSSVMNLSESHFSIHTYPEYQAAFVDCFTCGTKCQPDKPLRYLKKIFSAQGKIRTNIREIKI